MWKFRIWKLRRYYDNHCSVTGNRLDGEDKAWIVLNVIIWSAFFIGVAILACR